MLRCARLIPFIVDAGGRLGEEADPLLRSWARLAAGNDLKCENISDQAPSILRQYTVWEVVGGPAAEQREHGAPRGGRVRNSDAFPH